MKFVALALALLLAVGSQAASLQADAPLSPIAHLGSAMDVILDTLKKGLVSLDDTEYKQKKDEFIAYLENAKTGTHAFVQNSAPVVESTFNTVQDATKEFRTSFMAEIETSKAALEPLFVAFKEVVDKHRAEYRTLLEPFFKEYIEMEKKCMEEMKAKAELVFDQLHGKVSTNLEETKSKFIPLAEAIRSMSSTALSKIREEGAPYFLEYKEQAKTAMNQMKAVNMEDLWKKISPKVDEIKTDSQAIFETIASSINSS